MNIYDFTVKDIKGQDVSLQSFRGKVLLYSEYRNRLRFYAAIYRATLCAYGTA
ncbi:MAG: hypothetical protein LBD48_12220 [Treponema sp.]|nr:hypothetical protein [Treponema sp.]